ncbi:MAG TPA: CGNR zinc finger domain-containing protein [Kofleriaceae bacterium]
MIFGHYTEEALACAAALINTAAGDDERLPDVAALDEFVRTWQWTGKRERSVAELRGVQSLRPRLRRLWELDERGVVELVNELLREARALPQLVKHDHWDYHLHATSPDAPLAVRMAVDIAMAIIDVVRAKELSRLRLCEYPGCRHVVVDLSRNRSKRFCDAGCGNRAAVAAYRARQAGRPEPDAQPAHPLPWLDAPKPSAKDRRAPKPRR